MPPTVSGELVVYRASTYLARARTFYVTVDDVERGAVRGARQLRVGLESGPHLVSARYGSQASPATVIDIAPDAQSFAVIDFTSPTPDAGVSQSSLVVREADGPDEPSSVTVRLFGSGRKRSRREQATSLIALFLIAVGLVLAKAVNRSLGVTIAAAGAVIVVVLFFQGVRYRDD